jgi:plasmid stabilization system protein ParE
LLRLRLAMTGGDRSATLFPTFTRLPWPYVPSHYRFWPLRQYSYPLVYDTMAEPVRILRVVHMRRDLPRALAQLRH